MRSVTLCLVLVVPMALAACSDRPDLAGRSRYALPEDTPWPVLLPAEDLGLEPRAEDDPAAALQARAAALRTRAAALAQRPF